jgi:phage protein D
MGNPSPRAFYAGFLVKLNGAALTDAQANTILSVEVERNLYLPATACIKFIDAGPAGSAGPTLLSLANDTSFAAMGAAVEIQMGSGTTPVSVFKGEITSFEIDITEAGDPPLFVIRAYDKGHRLHRGRISKTFLNVTDSDMASTICSSAGLTASSDATSKVYDTVSQNNQTNWEFLVERARRIGYEVWVDDTTVHFRKPALTGSPVAVATLLSDLRSLNMRLTAGSQVAKVNTQSWDPQQKQQITGTASTPAQVATNAAMHGGSTLSSPFGSSTTMYIANHMATSQDEATTIAQAAFDEVTGDSLQIEGTMTGTPAVMPGNMLTIATVGSRFNGDYYVTSAVHRVDLTGGYTTQFTVTSRRANTLGELVGMAASASWNGNGHGSNQAPVIGIVTDNKDPDKKQGRVKVKLPYLVGDESQGQGIQTDWARLVVPGGGTTRGVYYLPEVNDEVLVAFEQGDINRPYILGGLWNGTDAPPKGNSDVLAADGKVNQRMIQSRTGHFITMDDTDSAQKVTVQTQGGHKVILDDTSGSPTITIKDSSGNNSIVIDTTTNAITITADGGDITLDSKKGNVVIKAMLGISMKAEQGAFSAESPMGAASVKGLSTSIEASTTGEVKATAAMTVSGDASLALKSTGVTQVQGSLIQLN